MNFVKLILKPFRQIVFGRRAYRSLFENEDFIEKKCLTPLINQQDSLNKQQESLIRKIESFEYAKYCGILEKLSMVSKKGRTIFFVDRDYFGDNTKYAFLYASPLLEEKGVKTFLVTHSKAAYDELISFGFNNIYRWDQNDNALIKDLLSSRFFVCSHHFSDLSSNGQILSACLAGAKQIQLWHGIPLKKIGIQSLKANNIWEAHHLLSCYQVAKFIGPSLLDEENWKDFFDFTEFASLGYPRNDLFFKETSPVDLISADIESYNSAKNAKKSKALVGLYSPTFRDNLESQWTDSLQLETLDVFLGDGNMLLLINFHPFDVSSFSKFSRSTFRNIIFVQQKSDIYPILKEVDFLITDYSSLAFDFSLLQKPIFIYRPDHEDYICSSRELFRDYDEQQVNVVVNICDTFKIYADGAYNLMPANLYFDHIDGKSSMRLADKIEQWLDLE